MMALLSSCFSPFSIFQQKAFFQGKALIKDPKVIIPPPFHIFPYKKLINLQKHYEEVLLKKKKKKRKKKGNKITFIRCGKRK